MPEDATTRALPLPMRFEYNLTFDEWRESFSIPPKTTAPKPTKTPVRHQSLLGWVLFIGLATVLFVMLNARRGSSATGRSTPDIFRLLIVFGVPVAAGIVYSAIGNRRRVSDLKRRWMNTPSLRERCAITLDLDHIIQEHPTFWNRHLWSTYARMAETKNLFVLTDDVANRLILPKRAIPADLHDSLRQFLANATQPPPPAFPVLPPSDSAAASEVTPPQTAQPLELADSTGALLAEVRYTAEDWQDYRLLPSARRLRRTGIFHLFRTCIFIALFVGPLFAMNKKVPLDHLLLLIGIYFLIALAILSIMLALLVFWAMNRRADSWNIHEFQRFFMDDAGLTLHTPLTTSHWSWPAFTGWTQTPNSFFLHLRDENHVLLIPLRAFTSPAALDQLKSHLPNEPMNR